VARRFSLTDHAFALDGYTDAWSRAYLNLRCQYSPNATLYPRQAYRAELFQGIGRGWEPSLSYDHMSFTSTKVDMYGVGFGKYVGNWYLRWRTLFIPSTTLGVSHRAVARYYLSGNADDYVELNGASAAAASFCPTAYSSTSRAPGPPARRCRNSSLPDGESGSPAASATSIRPTLRRTGRLTDTAVPLVSS